MSQNLGAPLFEIKYIISIKFSILVKVKVHPCTGTEALYRTYGP